jgi:hypothetical protein
VVVEKNDKLTQGKGDESLLFDLILETARENKDGTITVDKALLSDLCCLFRDGAREMIEQE